MFSCLIGVFVIFIFISKQDAAEPAKFRFSAGKQTPFRSVNRNQTTRTRSKHIAWSSNTNQTLPKVNSQVSFSNSRKVFSRNVSKSAPYPDFPRGGKMASTGKTKIGNKNFWKTFLYGKSKTKANVSKTKRPEQMIRGRNISTMTRTSSMKVGNVPTSWSQKAPMTINRSSFKKEYDTNGQSNNDKSKTQFKMKSAPRPMYKQSGTTHAGNKASIREKGVGHVTHLKKVKGGNIMPVIAPYGPRPNSAQRKRGKQQGKLIRKTISGTSTKMRPRKRRPPMPPRPNRPSQTRHVTAKGQRQVQGMRNRPGNASFGSRQKTGSQVNTKQQNFKVSSKTTVNIYRKIGNPINKDGRQNGIASQDRNGREHTRTKMATLKKGAFVNYPQTQKKRIDIPFPAAVPVVVPKPGKGSKKPPQKFIFGSKGESKGSIKSDKRDGTHDWNQQHGSKRQNNNKNAWEWKVQKGKNKSGKFPILKGKISSSIKEQQWQRSNQMEIRQHRNNNKKKTELKVFGNHDKGENDRRVKVSNIAKPSHQKTQALRNSPKPVLYPSVRKVTKDDKGVKAESQASSSYKRKNVQSKKLLMLKPKPFPFTEPSTKDYTRDGQKSKIMFTEQKDKNKVNRKMTFKLKTGTVVDKPRDYKFIHQNPAGRLVGRKSMTSKTEIEIKKKHTDKYKYDNAAMNKKYRFDSSKSNVNMMDAKKTDTRKSIKRKTTAKNTVPQRDERGQFKIKSKMIQIGKGNISKKGRGMTSQRDNSMKYPMRSQQEKNMTPKKAPVKSQMATQREKIIKPKMARQRDKIMKPKMAQQRGKTMKPKMAPKRGKILKPKMAGQRGKIMKPKMAPQRGKIMNPKMAPQRDHIIKPKMAPQRQKIMKPKMAPQHGKIMKPKMAPQRGKILKPKMAGQNGKIMKPKMAPQRGKIMKPKMAPQRDHIIKPKMAPQRQKIMKPKMGPQHGKIMKPKMAPQRGKIMKPKMAPQRGKIMKPKMAQQRGKIMKPKMAPQRGKIMKPKMAPQRGRIMKPQMAPQRGKIMKPQMAPQRGKIMKPRMVPQRGKIMKHKMAPQRGKIMKPQMPPQRGKIMKPKMAGQRGKSMKPKMVPQRGKIMKPQMTSKQGISMKSQMKRKRGKDVKSELKLQRGSSMKSRKEKIVSGKHKTSHWSYNMINKPGKSKKSQSMVQQGKHTRSQNGKIMRTQKSKGVKFTKGVKSSGILNVKRVIVHKTKGVESQKPKSVTLQNGKHVRFYKGTSMTQQKGKSVTSRTVKDGIWPKSKSMTHRNDKKVNIYRNKAVVPKKSQAMEQNISHKVMNFFEISDKQNNVNEKASQSNKKEIRNKNRNWKSTKSPVNTIVNEKRIKGSIIKEIDVNGGSKIDNVKTKSITTKQKSQGSVTGGQNVLFEIETPDTPDVKSKTSTISGSTGGAVLIQKNKGENRGKNTEPANKNIKVITTEKKKKEKVNKQTGNEKPDDDLISAKYSVPWKSGNIYFWDENNAPHDNLVTPIPASQETIPSMYCKCMFYCPIGFQFRGSCNNHDTFNGLTMSNCCLGQDSADYTPMYDRDDSDYDE